MHHWSRPVNLSPGSEHFTARINAWENNGFNSETHWQKEWGVLIPLTAPPHTKFNSKSPIQKNAVLLGRNQTSELTFPWHGAFTNAISVTRVSPMHQSAPSHSYHNNSPPRRKQGKTTSQTGAVLHKKRKEKRRKRQHSPETKSKLHESKTPNHEESVPEAVMGDEKSRMPDCRDFQNKAVKNPANGFT